MGRGEDKNASLSQSLRCRWLWLLPVLYLQILAMSLIEHSLPLSRKLLIYSLSSLQTQVAFPQFIPDVSRSSSVYVFTAGRQQREVHAHSHGVIPLCYRLALSLFSSSSEEKEGKNTSFVYYLMGFCLSER